MKAISHHDLAYRIAKNLIGLYKENSRLYVGMIPNSSGQLAELIVYIIPQEYSIVTRSYSR